MSIINQAIEIYRDEGLLALLSRVIGYCKSKIKGGLSSRPALSPLSKLSRPLINEIFKWKYGEGVKVMDEDWDTLILLDACRLDDFEQQYSFEGTLETRLSQGADSPEFIKKNFVGQELHETVYVTANPHVRMIGDDVFHAVIDDPLSTWDSKTKCVRPEAVTQAAIRAHEEYEDKRIIVHYMQPHDPPLGPTGDELREQFDLGGVKSTEGANETRLFEAVSSGDIAVEKAREAYRETLDIVLAEVERLLSKIEGRVIISSDHGEMFGEQPFPLLGELYEHYHHPHTLQLCKVPWLIIDQGTRRRTVPEPPVEVGKTGHKNLEMKLEALGYK